MNAIDTHLLGEKIARFKHRFRACAGSELLIATVSMYLSCKLGIGTFDRAMCACMVSLLRDRWQGVGQAGSWRRALRLRSKHSGG